MIKARYIASKSQLIRCLHHELFNIHDLIYKLHQGEKAPFLMDTKFNVYWQYLRQNAVVNELLSLLSTKLKDQIWFRDVDDEFHLHYKPFGKDAIPMSIILTPSLEINFKATPYPKEYTTTRVHPSVHDVLNKARKLISSEPSQRDLNNAAGLVLYGLQSLGERNIFMLGSDNKYIFMSKENAYRYFATFVDDVSKSTLNQLAKCRSEYVDLIKPKKTPKSYDQIPIVIKPVTAEYVKDMIQSIIRDNPSATLDQKI